MKPHLAGMPACQDSFLRASDIKADLMTWLASLWGLLRMRVKSAGMLDRDEAEIGRKKVCVSWLPLRGG